MGGKYLVTEIWLSVPGSEADEDDDGSPVTSVVYDGDNLEAACNMLTDCRAGRRRSLYTRV